MGNVESDFSPYNKRKYATKASQLSRTVQRYKVPRHADGPRKTDRQTEHS